MGEYILKGSEELVRLDEQSVQEQFSTKLELDLLNLNLNQKLKVLDAGCGSGALLRELVHYESLDISACDKNEVGLSYAEGRLLNANRVNFFHHDIVEQSFSNEYDLIFNRLVAHHLGEELFLKAVSNFYRSLSDGGRLVVVDIDGFFSNLGGFSKELSKKIDLVNEKFHGDICIGRKLPSIMKKAGFNNINWKIDVMDFQGADKEYEIDQWEKRLANSFDFYASIFDSELEAKRFINEYIDEMKRDDVPLFYNKFIVVGEK